VLLHSSSILALQLSLQAFDASHSCSV